jgi:branched-chain amino acid transport system ATP-binding protein
MMRMSKLLEVKNLVVNYGPIKALKGVDISVEEGSIVAILGSNGGGKTTLLKKISGLISSEEGEIIFDGEDITKKAAEKISGSGIIQSPEGRQIFPDLTVDENLRIGAFSVKKGPVRISKINKGIITEKIKNRIEIATKNASDDSKEDVEVILTRKEKILNNKARVFKYFPVLEERKTQIASTLSGGEQQMLAISRALMANPKLLVLDEPSLGLAPLIVRDIFNIIKEFKSEGVTILIVEQNALQTLKIADYAYVLQVGLITMEGKASQLKSNPALIDAYLGH